MYPVYYPVAGDTLVHLFGTYGGTNGESITMSGLAVTDIEIYKDGSVTQRASDAGYTLLDTDGIDFDSITGIHGFSIDLSDDTDSGFYSVGPWYHVVVSAITVDSQTVSFVACAFRIVSATRGLSGTALPDAAADAAGGLPISDAGGLDLDAQIGTDIDAILTDTAEIGAAGAGLTAVEVGDGTIDAAKFAADTNVYTAIVGLAKASTTANRYIVYVYKNGTMLAHASITGNPTLSVFATDGSTLFSGTALTKHAGSTYMMYLNETSNLITPGVGYGAEVTATIDGSSRVIGVPQVRDSA